MKTSKIQHYPTYQQTLAKAERYIQVVASRLGQDEHIDDLLNEGRVGLFQAWGKYQPESGEFHKYAITYIRYSMLKYLTSNARTIRIPQHKQMSEDFYENITIYTSTTLMDDSDSTIGDTLKADDIQHWDGITFEDEVDCASEAKLRLIRHYLSEMKPKHQKIFFMRQIEDMDFDDIGEEFGLSRQRVHQIYHKVVGNLKDRFGVNKKGPVMGP